MWTRQEVKHKGKAAFFKAYWKFVLVALILGVVTASGAGSNFSSSGSSIQSMVQNYTNGHSYNQDDYDDKDYSFDLGENEGPRNEINVDGHDIKVEDGNMVIDGKVIDLPTETRAGVVAAVVVIVLVVIVISLLASAVAIAVDIFVKNPIEYGCQKFLRKSQDEDTALGTVWNGFKDGYKNIVKVMFFRDLFITLWSLLFIIPGIVKSYEYRMVPFLLSENPEMTKDEALKTSSRMMKGQKWRTFVLDLSFIGWHLLSLLTLGALGIFYVSPYQNATNAALYETLKSEMNENAVTAV